MRFAEKLFDFRVDNNLSQEATARIIGVDQASVSAYESGKRHPTKVNEARFKKKMDAFAERKEGGV